MCFSWIEKVLYPNEEVVRNVRITIKKDDSFELLNNNRAVLHLSIENSTYYTWVEIDIIVVEINAVAQGVCIGQRVKQKTTNQIAIPFFLNSQQVEYLSSVPKKKVHIHCLIRAGKRSLSKIVDDPPDEESKSI